MGKHTIRIDPLSPRSIDRAIRECERLEKEFGRKVDIFLERLANLGYSTLDSLGYNGDSVKVTVEKIENGYAINAAGKGIVFLEFGAGDTVASGNRYAGQMPFEVRPGSYSETHARQYADYKRWIFGGVVYHEIRPREGMQTTWETIMQEWRRIAQEVFS